MVAHLLFPNCTELLAFPRRGLCNGGTRPDSESVGCDGEHTTQVAVMAPKGKLEIQSSGFIGPAPAVARNFHSRPTKLAGNERCLEPARLRNQRLRSRGLWCHRPEQWCIRKETRHPSRRHDAHNRLPARRSTSRPAVSIFLDSQDQTEPGLIDKGSPTGCGVRHDKGPATLGESRSVVVINQSCWRPTRHRDALPA